jgi:hypothetical protein
VATFDRAGSGPIGPLVRSDRQSEPTATPVVVQRLRTTVLSAEASRVSMTGVDGQGQVGVIQRTLEPTAHEK